MLIPKRKTTTENPFVGQWRPVLISLVEAIAISYVTLHVHKVH